MTLHIPLQITSGDSATWKDYPAFDNLNNQLDAPSWTLVYVINKPTAPLTLTAAQDGTANNWVTNITSVQSAAIQAGTYDWQAYVTKSTQRVTLGTGRIQFLANLATAGSTYDGRSQAQKDLDAVEQAIRANISGGAVAEYTIGNRSVRKIPLADLLVLRDRLRQVVRFEGKKAGSSGWDTVYSGLGPNVGYGPWWRR